MTRYPTKEEILIDLDEPHDDFIAVVDEWKIKHYNKKWRELSTDDKFSALEVLARVVAATGNSTPITVVRGTEWSYQPRNFTVTMGDTPSIISTLHEIGHHIFGRSETAACRFSISLFRTCFPKAYEALEWSGHMLIRKQTYASPT